MVAATATKCIPFKKNKKVFRGGFATTTVVPSDGIYRDSFPDRRYKFQWLTFDLLYPMFVIVKTKKRSTLVSATISNF